MNSKAQRLLSVDFLRGVTVAGMILVNNPGSWEYIYSPFEHAAWNGCTPTDLVFPFFLFLVGVSINLAFSNQLDKGKQPKDLYPKIVKRTVILFGLGLFIAAFPFRFDDLIHLRIPGVLQRISIVFFVCALIVLHVSKRNQYFIAGSILLLYYILMAWIPVPGYGEANLGKDTNLGAWLDRLLLDGHLWALSKTWDPEGVLSTLPAVSSGLLGIFAGDIIKNIDTPISRVNKLTIIGAVLIIIGLLWNFIFPINKSLWTSSYVCFTGGVAFIALAISYYLLDVKEIKTFTKPFLYFGANAITLYVGSELLAKLFYLITFGENSTAVSLKGWIYNFVNVPFLGPYNASLVIAMLNVSLFGIIAWVMYRRRIFIKV